MPFIEVVQVINFIKSLLKIFLVLNYFWLHWVFVAARVLSLVGVSGGYPLAVMHGLLIVWLLLLPSTGSRLVGSVVVQTLRMPWDPPGISSMGQQA